MVEIIVIHNGTLSDKCVCQKICEQIHDPNILNDTIYAWKFNPKLQNGAEKVILIDLSEVKKLSECTNTVTEIITKRYNEELAKKHKGEIIDITQSSKNFTGVHSVRIRFEDGAVCNYIISSESKKED